MVTRNYREAYKMFQWKREFLGDQLRSIVKVLLEAFVLWVEKFILVHAAENLSHAPPSPFPIHPTIKLMFRKLCERQ